jgi:hypothetical protein
MKRMKIAFWTVKSMNPGNEGEIIWESQSI